MVEERRPGAGKPKRPRLQPLPKRDPKRELKQRAVDQRRKRAVTRQSEHRFRGGPGGAESTTIFVDDPAVLKALTDPLRHRIVGMLNEPMSAKEVATALGVPATRLYYHLDLLVERGLAKVADHRTVGRNVERLFVRAGDRFVISEELSRLAFVESDASSELQRGVNEHVANLLALQRREKGEGPNADRDAIGAVMDIGLRLSVERARAFLDRMHDVVAEFESDAGADTDTDDAEKYGLLVMLAPRATGHDDGNDDEPTEPKRKKRSTR